MEQKAKKKFLVDVDDVLRSLVPNMVRIYNEEFNENMSYDDVTIYYVDKSFPKVKERFDNVPHWFFQVHGHELFYESEPIKGAVEAVNKLREYGTVEIVTKQRSTQNKVDTLMWLDRVGVKYDSVSFVTHKSIVCCDYFIDDFHENFIGCGSEGATGILINAPYNRNIDLNQLKPYTGFSRILRYDSLADFIKDIDNVI